MPAAEFAAFYRSALGLDAEDFERLLAAVGRPLPSAFRVTPTADRPAILERLARYSFLTRVGYLQDVYTFSLQERAAEYAEFMRFLVAQTSVGNIQRQEIVSMLPHLFLDAKCDSRVLETCAAPGSKTKQLLEAVETGLVVSNDRSPGRANILISEASKKASTSFVVTMADASQLPRMGTRFDRICCDVPCSSDGTARKNRPVYDRWALSAATGLCGLQQRILERALAQLADDGILVYSTCSLNPVENEYVVDRVLAKGGYELVLDTSRIQYAADDPSKITVRRGICRFECGEYSFENEELAKCIRVLPHDQDTGGFFIAILRRRAPAAAASAGRTPGGRFAVFHDVPQDVLTPIFACFGTPSDAGMRFVSAGTSRRSIYCVSGSAYDFIRDNPRLKVLHAGIKAFVQTDLDGGTYRAKNAYLERAGAAPSVWGTLDDLRALLESRVVDAGVLSFRARGHFSMGVPGLRYRFCGYGSPAKVFLYIDDSHRRALADLHAPGAAPGGLRMHSPEAQ